MCSTSRKKKHLEYYLTSYTYSVGHLLFRGQTKLQWHFGQWFMDFYFWWSASLPLSCCDSLIKYFSRLRWVMLFINITNEILCYISAWSSQPPPYTASQRWAQHAGRIRRAISLQWLPVWKSTAHVHKLWYIWLIMIKFNIN